MGNIWNPKDNFIKSTDKKGNQIKLEDIDVSGNVNTQKEGVYKVSYSYKGVRKVAKVTVRKSVNGAGYKGNNTGLENNNNDTENTLKYRIVKGNKKNYPKTGEYISSRLLVIGMLLLLLSLSIFFVKASKKIL